MHNFEISYSAFRFVMVNYIPATHVSLKKHSEIDEKWIQKLIEEDPKILGLGDLEFRDRERIQPHAGRLDLLLQDPDSQRRYEIEIQLGATDESHIIRAIEYYDIEKKRYPQYEHCAVLIAEDITSRFLNVISLFNGVLPLIAIQMQAISLGDVTTVVFTRVLDEMIRGVVDEDEDALAAPTDRDYWERKAAKKTLTLVDQMLEWTRVFEPSLKLKYTKHYIGIQRDGEAFNFVSFRPQKNRVVLRIKLPQSNDTDDEIDAAGLDRNEYNKPWGIYQIPLSKEDICSKSDMLKKLVGDAYSLRTNS